MSNEIFWKRFFWLKYLFFVQMKIVRFDTLCLIQIEYCSGSDIWMKSCVMWIDTWNIIIIIVEGSSSSRLNIIMIFKG